VITFLFFEIYHDSINSTNHIKLADRRDVTGKVKGGYDESPVFFMPCLIIDYYENDRLIHQSKMEHPLFRHVEHFGENEMGWHTIISQTAEFSLRCQKTAGNNKKIIISEKFDDEKNNELITINL
jgi:hypothetical protein